MKSEHTTHGYSRHVSTSAGISGNDGTHSKNRHWETRQNDCKTDCFATKRGWLVSEKFSCRFRSQLHLPFLRPSRGGKKFHQHKQYLKPKEIQIKWNAINSWSLTTMKIFMILVKGVLNVFKYINRVLTLQRVGLWYQTTAMAYSVSVRGAYLYKKETIYEFFDIRLKRL